MPTPLASSVPHPITIVGLGPGDPDLLTLAAARVLAAATTVWVRTHRHPAVAAIPGGVPVHTFDALYEAHDTFEAVYQAIAAALLAQAAEGPVVYAVPGDPAVGETAVTLLRQRAAVAGVPLTVVPGLSFVEPTLAALGWDALDGLQLADATELASRHHPSIDPDRPALIAQVYSRLVASDVKLVLLNQYPPEHPLTLVTGAGTGRSGAGAGSGEDANTESGADASQGTGSGASNGPGADGPQLATFPLYELDRRDDLGDLATLAVPPLSRPGSLLTLAEVVAHLRAPDGCPWDREQTHQSLRPYLLEEAHEVLAALDDGDPGSLAEELGDLLLQVVLHAQLAVEDGDFALTDVVRHITEKLLRRHPHVFGDVAVDTADQVRANWDALKAVERAAKGERDPLAGIPATLPALARAQAVQRKAGVTADETAQAAALAAVAHDPGAPAERDARLAAALWALAAIASRWGLDAETVLREATGRFAGTWTAASPAAGGPGPAVSP